jgi:hypothetical protein
MAKKSSNYSRSISQPTELWDLIDRYCSENFTTPSHFVQKLSNQFFKDNPFPENEEKKVQNPIEEFVK